MTNSDMQSMDADQSLRDWLDGLAGRPAAGGDAALGARRQGLLLRHLVMSRMQSSDESPLRVDDARVEQQWQRVKQRLSQLDAGKALPLDSPLDGSVATNRHGPHRMAAANRWTYAVAAGIASLAVGMTISLRTTTSDNDGAEIVMRGAAPAVHLTPPAGVSAAEYAARISAVLEARKVRYQITRLPDGIQIQFKLSSRDAGAVELMRMGLPVESGGIFNFVVRDSANAR